MYFEVILTSIFFGVLKTILVLSFHSFCYRTVFYCPCPLREYFTIFNFCFQMVLWKDKANRSREETSVTRE